MNGAIVAIAVLTAAVTVLGAAGGPQRKTVWDGIYTDEQAARGRQTYMRACAYCHRDNLEGDEGPALIGSRFTFQWRDRTLKELFDTVSTTMPDDAPGSLAVDQYADVIGFLLQRNDAPAGDTPLAADADALASIVFTEKPKR